MQQNSSGLIPLGRAVLVLPVESMPEFKTALIQIPDTVKDRLMLSEQQAVVIAIGPEAWKEEAHPRARPGDKVMISKHAGTIVPGGDGKQYRVVNANDLFLRIEEAEFILLAHIDKRTAA